MPVMAPFCRGCSKRLTVDIGDLADLIVGAAPDRKVDICVDRGSIKEWIPSDRVGKEGPRYFCQVCWNLLLPAALED